MSRHLLLALAALTAISCDRDNLSALPDPGDLPAILEIGEMQVITQEALQEFKVSNDPAAWCAETDDQGRPRCFYGQLSSSDASYRGGATFTYKGTGERVCLIVDPETVYWSHSVAASNPSPDWKVPDIVTDDGDLDLFSGLSSYYTGSPGIEIGDFRGFYSDSQGREVEIEYGACFQRGARAGFSTAHAGRGTVEFCTVDTDQRAGVEYTAVLETFSVPFDDGALSFATMVVEGSCTDAAVAVDECTMRGESRTIDNEYVDCTPKLEQAFCDEKMTAFCCANPEMCGEADDPLTACKAAFGEDGNGDEITRDAWCASSGLCCDGAPEGVEE